MKGPIFTFVLCYGGAFASLFKPWYGFLVYVCFGIIKPEWLWFWSLPPGNYSRIVALAMMAGWVLNGCGQWKFGRGGPVIASIFCYWLVMLFGTITASFPDRSWPHLDIMTKVVIPLLIGATLLDSVAKLRQLAWVIMLSQGYLAYEFNLAYYTRGIISGEFNHGGLDNNGIAMSAVTGMGLAFYMGLNAERRWHSVLAFCCSGLMAHVVLFSNSRGGMVSLIITAVLCFHLTPKRPREYVALVLGILVVWRLAGDGVIARFMTIFGDDSVDAKGGGRLEFWASCWDMLVQNPLGVGLAHFPVYCSRYGINAGRAAHSTWMQTAAELGWPGLLFLLVGVYGICIKRLWPLTKEKTPVPDPWLRYLARMVVSGLVGFIIAAQFLSAEAVEVPYYLALLGAGTLKMASQAENSPLVATESRRRFRIPFRHIPQFGVMPRTNT